MKIEGSLSPPARQTLDPDEQYRKVYYLVDRATYWELESNGIQLRKVGTIKRSQREQAIIRIEPGDLVSADELRGPYTLQGAQDAQGI